MQLILSHGSPGRLESSFAFPFTMLPSPKLNGFLITKMIVVLSKKVFQFELSSERKKNQY